MKRCPRCGKEKELSEFYRKRNGEGLYSYCKPCHKQLGNEWNRAHRDEVNRRSRERYKPHPVPVRSEQAVVVCKRCGEGKPPADFYPGRKHGLLSAYCRICHGDLSKEWYYQNTERTRERNRKWLRANREAARAYQRRRYAANLEQLRAQKRDARRQRLARQAGAAGSHTPEQLQARIDYYGGLCWMCGVAWQEVDHVIPLARGGSNWASNLRPSCSRCNRSKRDRLPSELEVAS